MRDLLRIAWHRTAKDQLFQAGLFPMFKPALKMNSVEAVGSYAIRIHWNDGHSSGIYSFDHLRKICPCAECRAKRD